ncbi:hypothetical protein [Streptomyces sp. NPDC058330]|uniref:hypothetical protein n=1 Tax=Streptomyces sp. NPDC058330 TaxID=3346449 RepID=UPI0036ED4305
MSVSLGAFLVAFGASGCTFDEGSGTDEKTQLRLCDVPASSGEGKLLRQVLDATELTTTFHNDDDDITEKLPERLREEDFQGLGFPLEACSYTPQSSVGSSRLSLEYRWVARDRSAGDGGELPGKVSHYRMGDAVGESNDISSRLRVECALPGDVRKASSRALLQGEASNTLDMGTEVEQVSKDRQVSFLYLMLRRAVGLLGCTNDPLTEDPVAKPYATASEAAAL